MQNFQLLNFQFSLEHVYDKNEGNPGFEVVAKIADDWAHNTIRTISKKFLSFRSFFIFGALKMGNKNHTRARRRKLRCVALRQVFKRMSCYVNYTDSHAQM